ncbi:unnamed protein product [Choristocarpus tenellus]
MHVISTPHHTPLPCMHQIFVVFFPNDGTRFWVVRNSWGEYWGEGGWFRIKSGENQLLIESACAWAVPGSWSKLEPHPHHPRSSLRQQQVEHTGKLRHGKDNQAPENLGAEIMSSSAGYHVHHMGKNLSVCFHLFDSGDDGNCFEVGEYIYSTLGETRSILLVL